MNWCFIFGVNELTVLLLPVSNYSTPGGESVIAAGLVLALSSVPHPHVAMFQVDRPARRLEIGQARAASCPLADATSLLALRALDGNGKQRATSQRAHDTMTRGGKGF